MTEVGSVGEEIPEESQAKYGGHTKTTGREEGGGKRGLARGGTIENTQERESGVLVECSMDRELRTVCWARPPKSFST